MKKSVVTKTAYLVLLVLCQIQMATSPVAAQQTRKLPFEDEIIKNQVAAWNGINAEYQNHIKFCEKIKRNMSKATRNSTNMRSGDSVDNATGEDYLNCASNRFEFTLRTWLSGNNNFLIGTSGLLKNVLNQQISDQTVSKAQIQSLANAAAFIHTRLKSWHQAMANLSHSLFTANLFTESQNKEIMDAVQANINAQTAKAREFLGRLNALDKPQKAEVVALLDAFVDDVFNPLSDINETMHAKCQVALKRIKDLYPDDLGKRPNRFHEVVDLYENTIVSSTEAMQIQTLNMWLAVNEKGQLDQKVSKE